MPMGPNRVLTVRGRKSGEPRPAPVAVVEIEGRRWVVGTFGEVHWVRNLRAAGEAELLIDGRQVQVVAHELDREEALAFYGNVLPRYVARMPSVSQPFLRFFIGRFAPEVFDDPGRAAATRPVFELREQNGADTSRGAAP